MGCTGSNSNIMSLFPLWGVRRHAGVSYEKTHEERSFASSTKNKDDPKYFNCVQVG